MHQDIETYYRQVKSDLDESATLQQIESQIQTSVDKNQVPASVADELQARFRAEWLTRNQVQGVGPRLLVDWGEIPTVGHQVRPKFGLFCPGYSSRPEIRVEIDRHLDHDDAVLRPSAHEEDPKFWTFHTPFCMTTGASDCRPGQYLIVVYVSFREVPPELPRFYRCGIRLSVPDQQSGDKGTLEIDGDGQSLINLQGLNLEQFSKVRLKGCGAGVINLQQLPDDEHPRHPDEQNTDKPATTFEYQLKVDSEKQGRVPAVYRAKGSGFSLDKAGLYFEDGRRTLFLTGRRISFGRSRDNDIVLRFMPPGSENDALSLGVSRTHFECALIPDGLELLDVSRSGLEVNYAVVRERAVVPASWAGEITHLDVGVTATVDKQFRLELLMFGPDRRDAVEDLAWRGELFCELVGGQLGHVWREALNAGLNAVRFDRVENSTEESYVWLLREALIGGSRSQSAIVLNNGGPSAQARLLHIDHSFWLEPLSGGEPISVDGNAIRPPSLIQLSPGMEIRMGTETARFDRFSQSCL